MASSAEPPREPAPAPPDSAARLADSAARERTAQQRLVTSPTVVLWCCGAAVPLRWCRRYAAVSVATRPEPALGHGAGHGGAVVDHRRDAGSERRHLSSTWFSARGSTAALRTDLRHSAPYGTPVRLESINLLTLRALPDFRWGGRNGNDDRSYLSREFRSRITSFGTLTAAVANLAAPADPRPQGRLRGPKPATANLYSTSP